MRRSDNIFNDVATKNPDSNTFDLSHNTRTTFNMGQLVPIALHEVIPGDKWSIKFANYIRFAPMLAPVMANCRVRTDYWFVPNRITFPDWEKFFTGVDEVVEWPYLPNDSDFTNKVLAAYFGIPAGDYGNTMVPISVLPFAAYAKIYDEFYRDQNLQVERFKDVIPGNNALNYNLLAFNPPLSVCWEKDYFTSCLPFPQQGANTVSLPLVLEQDIPVDFTPNGNPGAFVNPDNGASLGAGNITEATGPSPFSDSTFVGTSDAAYNPRGSLTVDVAAQAASINDLREAFAMQAFLELTIRGGQRYTEQIRSHFGVSSSDARLQRPELIGRHIQTVTFSEVLATAANVDEEIPVGGLYGHGISVGANDHWTYYAEEHGLIIGLVSIIPDTEYMDGINRLWFRDSRFEYPYPMFAHLGERAVPIKELLSHGLDISGTDPDETFGYQEQYAELRYQPSLVTGDFRSDYLYWHLGRKFSPISPPALNSAFVTADPSNRIFAVTDNNVDHVFMTIVNKKYARRKLPRFGVPQLIG